ncbi:hypothetical protein [Candidatus Chromulinivorax destructor]|uniref:Uncharacterized protein n=1 Tax=Candidatus Chromulinivorax destructor TaxID=2066483 RepID=A0A345ZAD2_9BACT|nr:hypothetical protein [Candidatus Chromulinivorax destructor]AXK60249.1 hypothetical protein C0J27_00590 [Candidatus Chromulinivorax destructor]
MKKLQLLALSMLLSTPFAVTYTSYAADAADATETTQAAASNKPKVASKNDGRQAERQARRDDRRSELTEQLKAIQAKKVAFMNSDADLQAQKEEHGQTLRAQIKSVEDDIRDLNLSDVQSKEARAALLNLHQERDTLRSRLERHKYKLQARKSLLMGHVDCMQNHIADLQAKQDELTAQLNGKAQDNAQVVSIQKDVDSIKKEIETKQGNVIALQAKVDAAQKALDALQDKKSDRKMQAVQNKRNS